jgi:hypothetical protein
LAERGVPAVDAFGTVVDRSAPDGTELGGLLITRHLPFSLPYRSLFTGRGLPDLRARLLDSLAELFVRLHLAGFYWGDCSLSNTLFRRDAGALAAYLVDAETGELHERLSPGQRDYDITIATENIAGELFDLQASGNFAEDVDPVETAMALAPQYENLWAELTSDEIVGRDESYRGSTTGSNVSTGSGSTCPSWRSARSTAAANCASTPTWSIRATISAGCSS